MEILFEHKKITSDLIGNHLYTPRINFIIAFLIFAVFIVSEGLSIKIIIFTSIFIIFGTVAYLYRPYDKIIVTPKSILIQKYGQIPITVNFSDVDSFKSESVLSLKLKSGEYFKIGYSDWMLSRKKIKELKNILNEII